MKRYNQIKNIMLASATAILYYGWIVDGVDTFKKIFATVAIFALMLILLRDADKQFMRETSSEWAKRRERMRHER